MRKLIEEHLQNVIVPFWMALKDGKYGGYYGHVGSNLAVHRDADKGLVQQARHLYAFARLENHYKDGRYLPYAETAYRFLKDVMRDASRGGYRWIVSRSGKTVDDRKVTYGHGFVLYGLAEYYKATQNPAVLAEAIDLFVLIEKTSARANGGYREEFSVDWQELPARLLTDGIPDAAFSTNTLLHLLEAYSNLLEAVPNETVADAIHRLIGVFVYQVQNRETGRFSMYFDQEFLPIASERSYGHEVEASWLIARASRLIGVEDPAVDELTRVLGKGVLRDGFNGQSVDYESGPEGNDPTAVWWVQLEAMIGFYQLYRDEVNQAAKTAAESVFAFTLAHLADKRRGGEWFWSCDKNGIPNRIRGIAELWKTPYHVVRALVELMERIDKS